MLNLYQKNVLNKLILWYGISILIYNLDIQSICHLNTEKCRRVKTACGLHGANYVKRRNRRDTQFVFWMGVDLTPASAASFNRSLLL